MNKFKLHFSNGDTINIQHNAETEEEAIDELFQGRQNFHVSPKGTFNLDTLVRIQKIEGGSKDG